MPRLTLLERLVAIGLWVFLFLLFGLVMPWWLFVVFVVALTPMFYKLLTM